MSIFSFNATVGGMALGAEEVRLTQGALDFGFKTNFMNSWLDKANTVFLFNNFKQGTSLKKSEK